MKINQVIPQKSCPHEKESVKNKPQGQHQYYFNHQTAHIWDDCTDNKLKSSSKNSKK